MLTMIFHAQEYNGESIHVRVGTQRSYIMFSLNLKNVFCCNSLYIFSVYMNIKLLLFPVYVCWEFILCLLKCKTYKDSWLWLRSLDHVLFMTYVGQTWQRKSSSQRIFQWLWENREKPAHRSPDIYFSEGGNCTLT